MRTLSVICVVLLAAVNIFTVQAQEPEPDTAGQPPAGEGSRRGFRRQEQTEREGRRQRPVPDNSSMQELLPRFRDRAVVLDINARIIEGNQQDTQNTWNESHRKATFPGQPVSLRLVGANVVVVVQFTPYIRRTQKFLLAQGQVWMEVPGQGMRYQTSTQTIPLEFNDPIFFFPLGTPQGDDSECIEIMLTLYPYEEEKEE
jgi:hypothetical protein